MCASGRCRLDREVLSSAYGFTYANAEPFRTSEGSVRFRFSLATKPPQNCNGLSFTTGAEAVCLCARGRKLANGQN